MSIVFHTIRNGNIFCADFEDMKKNNIIEFPSSGIAIIYGPNGTGKTSLAKALKHETNSEYELSIDGNRANNKSISTFHIISDQNGRHIIEGDTEDFILGDNIKREYELKRLMENNFNEIFSFDLIPKFKQIFGISTKGNALIQKISNLTLRQYVSDLANNKSKGKNIDRKDFIEVIETLPKATLPEYDEDKFRFLINDFAEGKSIIEKIINLGADAIKKDASIQKIEETDEAIKVLEKYDYLTECIVCDAEIDRPQLLERKRLNKTLIYNALDEKTKLLLEEIIKAIKDFNDPFKIKEHLLNSIRLGDYSLINHLKGIFYEYIEIFNHRICDLFAHSLDEKKVAAYLREYEKIIQEKPEFSHEDVLFIEKFVNECIDKKIELKRDEDNNLNLFLDNKEFLNVDRNNLFLSNGEQNFISLAFELLKAKKVNANVVILDDPISSFDSIYKNKIAYAIIKFLETKKQIILTHSTELIKLLEHQEQGCFNLYLLNNTDGEENGFIHINKNEQDVLLYIHKLLELFRSEIGPHILNERNYLISTIPFMRGYSQIINDKTSRDKLTKVMHGYEVEKINVTEIYNQIFGCNLIKEKHELSAEDVVIMNIDNIEILKNKSFPLLNRTLRHTLTYLHLRLSVEKKLVDKFSINTKKHEMLSAIIHKSFGSSNPEDTSNRVFLLSRKTLLNEFNHFEVDMNIFQPAIDITDTALKRERDEIIKFLERL